MKINTLLTIASTSVVLTFAARADFFDNFDSYANQAGLLAVWNATTPTGTGLQLSQSTPDPVSAPNDVENTGTAAYRIVRATGGVQAKLLYWSFDLYDSGGSRDFNGLYAYTGAWGAGLQTVVQFGIYNTGVGNKYMGRYSSISGAVYGDGAVATTADGGTGGWFSLTSAGNRASGAWHHMEVAGMVDPNDASKLKLQFYVDGLLGGSIWNVPSYNLTYATVGGAVSTTAAGAAYDNFQVVTVPEPSSVALCLLGGLSLAAGVVSRRRKV